MEINLLSADIIFRKYAEDEYQSKNKKKASKNILLAATINHQL